MESVLILIGKLISLVSRITNLGAGATWPGEIALRLYPGILEKFSGQGKQIILVAGTNGKTTTAKMIETVLRNAGKKVRRNQSGANLDNGLVSTFIADAKFDGKLTSDYFIFEVDEATLPNVLKQMTPNILVLNNLFRDQLDRYGEVDTIAEKWTEALCHPREGGDPVGKKNGFPIGSGMTVIINADDPHLAYIGSCLPAGRSQLKVQVKYFGLEEPSLFLNKMQHATDTIYCPRCGGRLTFGGVYFSHLGKWTCGKCGLNHPDVEIKAHDFASPLEGVYNQYNTLAAALVCRELGLTDEQIKEGLVNFKPAFGRMETISIDGPTSPDGLDGVKKLVKILLSKNPTGFNESLRTYLNAKETGPARHQLSLKASAGGPLLLVLNDRIPDGTDISWIWDVDFELLEQNKQSIFVSGDRCYDMALRLKYADVPTKGVYRSLEEAIRQALENTKTGETLWILPTYSAMLEVRKILTGRKI